jgi:hypothetical protein
LPNSGTLSPNPWDLSLSGQNGWPYTEGTRTEDKAPQGCDLSAASSAGMAVGGVDATPLQTNIQTRRTLTYCGHKMVLTTGSTLLGLFRSSSVNINASLGRPVRICASCILDALRLYLVYKLLGQETSLMSPK